MSDKLTIYNNMIEAMNALAPFYQDAAVEKIREAGARDSWYALLLAAAVDPAPLSWERILAISPYTAPQRMEQMIDEAVEGGFLEGDMESGFTLTADGRSVLSAFFDTAQEMIGSAPALPADDMELLAGCSKRLVAATENLDYPREKPNLENSLWTDPGLDAPLMTRIDQNITDLRLFRDDAHITAWQVNDIDGHSWETLTFIWRDDAHSAAELVEKLPRRGYEEADYTAALGDLANKGWIEDTGDGWQITESGRDVRQKAEDETNRIFFAGWDSLDETELNELDELVERLLNTLKEAAPVAEPA